MSPMAPSRRPNSTTETNDVESLRWQLSNCQRNLRLLQEQRTNFGAGEEPLNLLVQIDQETESIAKLEKQIDYQLSKDVDTKKVDNSGIDNNKGNGNPPVDRNAPTWLPFVNREEEIKEILSAFAAAYHLVSAPPGYGKTYLLQHLKLRFEEDNWLCVYVSVSDHQTMPDIAQAIIDNLGLSASVADLPKQKWGETIGQLFIEHYQNAFNPSHLSQKGLAILLDIDGRPWNAMQDAIEHLFNFFVPQFKKKLENSTYFSETHNRFRVVFTGRYLVKHIPKNASLTFAEHLLTPFKHQYVREVVERFITNASYHEQFTAHLLYYSAGHPGGMSQILNLYLQRGLQRNLSPDQFFSDYEDLILNEIIWKEGDTIRRDIDPALRSIFDTLSSFRYLDYEIIRLLITRLAIISDQTTIQFIDEVDLADNLTSTYLIGWSNRLLRGDIIRGLLLRRLSKDITNEAFIQRCRMNQEICLEYFALPHCQMPEQWLVEYLFQYLQQLLPCVQIVTMRQQHFTDFFTSVLPKVLEVLSNNQNPRRLLTLLRRALNEDWELQFAVNYYLRTNEYNTEPFQQLMQRIEKFSGSLNKG